VLRVFARNGTLPALVHCAHGKDRTGVVIMLLLAACGVPQEVIVDDYIEVLGCPWDDVIVKGGVEALQMKLLDCA
jgi:hypothetical protein